MKLFYPMVRAILVTSFWLATLMFAAEVSHSATQPRPGGLAGVTATPNLPGDWYGSWTDRRKLTINHLKVSGGVDLTDFPVFVTVTDPLLKSAALGGRVGRNDGGDILFTTGDGVTKLDHELSSYSASSGEITAWVRVPIVAAATDTILYVYYGNGAAGPQQNPRGVWDSHYLGVWHLDSNPTLSAADASAKAADGTIDGASVSLGVIGGGASFDGKTSSIRIPAYGGTVAAATFSMWINLRSHDDWAGLLYSRASNALGAHFSGSTNNLAYTWNSDPASYLWNSGLQLPVNNWAYASVAVSPDRATITLCAAGSCRSAVNVAPHYPVALGTEFRMARDAYLTRYFEGSLDEVRLSDLDRSPGWTATEYANQFSPGTFFAFGSPETITAQAPAVSVTVNSTPSGLGLVVDGASCTAPCAFLWAAGSSHSLAAPDLQNPPGIRYRFLNWTDGGAQTHTFAVPAAATNALAIGANYDIQYSLTTAVSPASAGTIAPVSGWYSAGSSLTLSATPAAGYRFTGFQGAVVNSTSPLTWTINAPSSISASFATIPVLSGPGSQSSGLILRPGEFGFINDPYYGQDRSWRIEFQMFNWTPPLPGQFTSLIFQLGGEGVYATLWPDGRFGLTDFADVTASKGPCFLPLANRNNVLVRFQRDVPKKRLVCEIWNTDGTGYAQNSDVILETTPASNIGLIGSPNTSASLGFLRVATTLLDDGGSPPSKSDSGDWTELKFNGSLNDSSGNGHNIALNTPVFIDMTQQPQAVVSGGAPNGWTGWVTLRAGFPNKLDGTRSKAGAGTLKYQWEQTGGPTTLIWSSKTDATPTIEGLVLGTYSVRLTIVDSGGGTSTANVDFGAVATDNNGVVIYPDPALDVLLGPSLAFGYNPWDWFDYRNAAISQYWMSKYEVNGGPWKLETDLDTVGGLKRAGKAYVGAGGSKIYGIGTNFLSVFCNGAPGPAVYALGTPYFVAKLPTGVANEAPRLYPRAIQSCQSDTEITMANGWIWERPQVDPPGIDWATWNLCATCGDWFGLQTTSNINFYGNDLANYALYFRSGMTKARDSARWLADRWYRSPWNLFGQTPRDFGLAGAYLRAVADGGHPVWDMWPTLRAFNSYCYSPSGYINERPMVDVRETAYCLGYTALQALFDPDPVSRQTAKDRVVSAYNWQFGSGQTAEGAYLNNAIEGDFSRSFTVTNGSAVAKLNTGPAIPADYCGMTFTSTGSISVAQDRVTVTGAGTNFLNSAGKIIVLRGTLNGQPWSMTSQVASNPPPSAASLTLIHPWRGDPGSVSATEWRIYDGSIRGSGFFNMFFGQTDAGGAYPYPQVLDEDNWYWCTVNDGQTLTLDKPYAGDTSGGNNYRRPSWQNLTGRGTQPFIIGIVAWAEHLASKSLEGYNDTVAAGYRTAMEKTADWIWTYGRNPATKGLFYGVGFSNCRNLSILPAHECAMGPADASTERSYNVESNGAFARKYLSTFSGTDRARGDAYYNDQFARRGYNSPLAGDGNFADILDPCCSYNYEKEYGQVFGIGQGHQWPAARLGGVQPPAMVDVPVPTGIAGVPGAATAKIVVNAPSGAVSEVTCSAALCPVKIDVRQGAHWVQVVYLSSSGSTIQTAAPFLVKTP